MSETVWVQRHRNDWRKAEFLRENVTNLHWSQVSGGVGARAPGLGLYGYVMCDALVDGELSHSCAHGPGPHRIKVRIVAKDDDRMLIRELQAEAGPKPDGR